MAEPPHDHEATLDHALLEDDISPHDLNLADLVAVQSHVLEVAQGHETRRSGRDTLDQDLDQHLQDEKGDHALLDPGAIPGQGHIPGLEIGGGDLEAEADHGIGGDTHVLGLVPEIEDVESHFLVADLVPEIEVGGERGPVQGPIPVTEEGGLVLVPDPRRGGGVFVHGHIPGIATASWCHGVGNRLPIQRMLFFVVIVH